MAISVFSFRNVIFLIRATLQRWLRTLTHIRLLMMLIIMFDCWKVTFLVRTIFQRLTWALADTSPTSLAVLDMFRRAALMFVFLRVTIPLSDLGVCITTLPC